MVLLRASLACRRIGRYRRSMQLCGVISQAYTAFTLLGSRRMARLCSMLGMLSLIAIVDSTEPARSAGIGQTDTRFIVRLIDQWGEASARCRAVEERYRAASESCGTVHRVMVRLDDLGWCYGHESDPGPFFRRWHRCEFESLHPPRP